MRIYEVISDTETVLVTRSESRVQKYWEDNSHEDIWVNEHFLDVSPHKEFVYNTLEEFVEAH